jgi:sec-independent protein translocase protein TatB
MMMPPRIELANLGMWDSLILMVMALVVFGPRRLPEIGRQIGKLMYEVRKASNDFKFQMEEELRKAEDVDRSKKEEQRMAALALAPSAPAVVDSQAPNSGPGAPVISPDAQVSEARPGAPLTAGAEGIESPYPGEAVYPAVSPADFQSGEPYPRIQPPSIGEPVEAERPGRRSAPLELPAAEAASEITPVTNPVTEQANHG